MTHHHNSWCRSIPLGTSISQKVKYQCVNMGFFMSITAWLNGWGWFLMYKGYFKTNLPYFRRMFLRLTYTDITEHRLKLTNNRDNNVTKRWSSCVSTCCTHVTLCVIPTLCKSVLELIPKPNHTEPMCYVKYLETKDDFYDTSACFPCLVNVFMSLKC